MKIHIKKECILHNLNSSIHIPLINCNGGFFMNIKYNEIMALALEAKQLQEQKISSYEGRIQSKSLRESLKVSLQIKLDERKVRLEEINKIINDLSEYEVEVQR